MRGSRRVIAQIAATLVLLLADHRSASLQPSSTTARKFHVSEYASHWETLLADEYDETATELRDRRKSWSRRRLEESGISIFGASAEPESEVLGEKIVRVYKQGETRLRDRFTRGDVMVMTPVIKVVDPIPRECLIVDVGKDWLTVGVGSSWPDGLWEARKLPGFFQVRLDRTAPKAPLRAQRIALDRIRKRNGGMAAALLSGIFHDATHSEVLASAFPPRFEDMDLESAIRDALEKAKSTTEFQPNQSQQDAITWALQRQISLIRGPPGTGKTRVAALLVSTALRLRASSESGKGRVLAVTHSNGAADVLLEALLQMGVPAVRLGRPASVSTSVQHRTVIAMTEKMPQVITLRQRAADTSLDSQLRSAAAFELRQCVADIQDMITRTAPVVVTSCIGANQLFLDEDEEMSFPTVVLDEAAQTTEPALLCALAASKAEQLILVGDTRQLPPTITAMSLRDSLGISPMARLEKCGVGETTLRVQYRMPSFLLEHPSKYFYKGLVTCAENLPQSTMPPPRGFPWPSSQPLAFVQNGDGDSEIAHNFGGRSNPSEAELVVSIVTDLIAAGDVDPSNIAVISPYSKQVQRIRTELSASRLRNGQKNGSVRVGTVDSFQGQETDVVIFSAVRSNPLSELGFLRDSRRLCVAITRARRGLILVGDKTVLNTCRHWAALLESCKSRGCALDATDLTSPSETIESDPIRLRTEVDSDMSVDDALRDLFDDNDELFGLFRAPSGNTA